jgi:hypothetical protein
VKNLGLLLEVGLQEDLVGLFLGLAEDDGAAVPTAIQVDDICDDRVTVVVGAVEGEVLDGLGGTDFGVLDKVYDLSVGTEIGAREFDHPGGNGCRE